MMAMLTLGKGGSSIMHPIVATLLAGTLFGPMVATGWAAPAAKPASQTAPREIEITAEQVRSAIERGVAYLKSVQKANGTWEEWDRQPGGTTALCALALLNSGVEPSDANIQKALSVIRRLEPEMTYATALATMVLARAEPQRDLSLINRNVKWLEGKQITSGPRKGTWAYPEGFGDNSNSQFALLALYEAERVGVVVSDETWRLAKIHWERDQNDDGSWSYPFRAPSPAAYPGTGSMTCAGISSLVIAADRIRASDAKVTGDQIDCCIAQSSDDDDRIDRALRWLRRYFSVSSNPKQPYRIWSLYYLYGLERAGRLTARRFIGDHDWYREGADRLVRQQDGLSGFWTSRGTAEENPIIGTSFALLFLSKGRWPVLLGKVKHPPDDDWNQHRGDVNNLTRYVESRWKRDLTWQVVDVRQSSVEDLLQTPVLYLCGSKSPLPETREEQEKLAHKLRDYLDRSGFLFAEAYCGGAGFDKGFRELMRLAFPEPEYKLRLLEPAHPVWYAEEKVDPRQLRPLWGLEFGCRTSVIYAPLDPLEKPRPSLSCLWELSRPGRGEKYSPIVQAQINAATSLGLNVLAYATNRELQTKEGFFGAKAETRRSDQLEQGRLEVATLRHPGGCNAAPRAVTNLMDAAASELKHLKVRPGVRATLLDMTDNALFDYPLVFMHGRTAFRLTPAEQQHLKTYLERGGMLLADSICASPAFTESFRHEMATIFPNRKLERIPFQDPLLTSTYGGFDLKLVSRRDPAARGAAGGPLETPPKQVPPELEGIKFQDRWGVVFSPYDLSCALEKRNSLECRGYLREDAARIGLNVLLYASQH
jgi:hypothetical protein